MNLVDARYFLVLVLALCLQGIFILPSNAQGEYFATTNNGVYVKWLSSVSYKKSTYVPSTYDSNSGVAIHWNIQDDMIHLAVVAQATGWASFGIAESGSMRGADIVMYTAINDSLTDTYVLDQLVTPIKDNCQSWELVNSVVDGGFIIFEAKRLLDTGDAQDRVIIDDSSSMVLPSRVIAAWGNSSVPSFHGRNAVRGTMRFFGTSDMIDEKAYFAQVMEAESQGHFTIGAVNYTIPSDVVTTYQLFCYSRDDFLSMGVPIDQDLHAIGFETLVQPGNEKYIHHIIAYATVRPWNNSLPCNHDKFNENAYAWATGDLPLVLPPNVGGPLGRNGYQSFALEIHYDNSEMTVNVTDNSAVRIYYTNVKREYDLGIFQVGDPIIGLRDTLVSPQGGLVQHSFNCGYQCLQEYLTQPVTVIKEHLHMHKAGVNMVNNHIRNDQVIRQGRVDFWDFNQQGLLGIVQAPFQMNPGDSFNTVCSYDTSTAVKWGLAAEEEMCVAFLYYYPRQATSNNVPIMCGVGTQWFLPGCFVQHETTPDFTTVEQLERIFGSPPASCPDKFSTSNGLDGHGSTSSAPFMATSIKFMNWLGFVMPVTLLCVYV